MTADVVNGTSDVLYNYLELPIQIEISGGPTIADAYNDDAQRLSKKVDASTVAKYIYGMDGQVIAEYNGGNTLTTWKLGGFGHKVKSSGPPFATESYYYIKDHIGNIRVTIDENANIVTKDDYYPFGLRMEGFSFASGNPYDKLKYSAKELDQEGGLNKYHFGWRDYYPELGRWVVVDPARQFASPYVGIGNNPINYYDPDGMITWKGILISVGINVVGITIAILTEGTYGGVGYWDDETDEWNGIVWAGPVVIGGGKDERGGHIFGQYITELNSPPNSGVSSEDENNSEEDNGGNSKGERKKKRNRNNRGKDGLPNYDNVHFATYTITWKSFDHPWTDIPVFNSLTSGTGFDGFFMDTHFADGSYYCFNDDPSLGVDNINLANNGGGGLVDAGLADPTNWIPVGRFIGNTRRFVHGTQWSDWYRSGSTLVLPGVIGKGATKGRFVWGIKGG